MFTFTDKNKETKQLFTRSVKYFTYALYIWLIKLHDKYKKFKSSLCKVKNKCIFLVLTVYKWITCRSEK